MKIALLHIQTNFSVRLSLDGQKLAGKEKMVDGNTVSEFVGKQLEVKLSLAGEYQEAMEVKTPSQVRSDSLISKGTSILLDISINENLSLLKISKQGPMIEQISPENCAGFTGKVQIFGDEQWA